MELETAYPARRGAWMDLEQMILISTTENWTSRHPSWRSVWSFLLGLSSRGEPMVMKRSRGGMTAAQPSRKALLTSRIRRLTSDVSVLFFYFSIHIFLACLDRSEVFPHSWNWNWRAVTKRSFRHTILWLFLWLLDTLYYDFFMTF